MNDIDYVEIIFLVILIVMAIAPLARMGKQKRFYNEK